MFTPGKKIFALVFISAFVIFIAYQYYKDHKDNKDLFKGVYLVLISLVALMVGYVLLNKALH